VLYQFHGSSKEDRAGFSVSSAGDLDGDGRDDVIVGAPGVNSETPRYGGEAYSITAADLMSVDNADGRQVE